VYYRLAYSHTTYEGVYYDEFSGEWYANLYRYISAYDKELRKTLSGKHQIICATEAGPPPDDWRPEEGK
jgi:hypothetical protein